MDIKTIFELTLAAEYYRIYMSGILKAMNK